MRFGQFNAYRTCACSVYVYGTACTEPPIPYLILTTREKDSTMLSLDKHQAMQRMSIATLYEFKGNCERENTRAALIIAEWCQYYIDCKYKGRYS